MSRNLMLTLLYWSASSRRPLERWHRHQIEYCDVPFLNMSLLVANSAVFRGYGLARLYPQQVVGRTNTQDAGGVVAK
jgi:hypothetical protein